MVVGEPVAVARCGEGFAVDVGQAWHLETMFRYTKETGMEMHRACLRSNSIYEPEAHHEGAIELVTVMKGKVSIQVESDVYELNEFDSIQFEANKKHSYKNEEDEVAVLHLTMKYFHEKSPIEKSIGILYTLCSNIRKNVISKSVA